MYQYRYILRGQTLSKSLQNFRIIPHRLSQLILSMYVDYHVALEFLCMRMLHEHLTIHTPQCMYIHV